MNNIPRVSPPSKLTLSPNDAHYDRTEHAARAGSRVADGAGGNWTEERMRESDERISGCAAWSRSYSAPASNVERRLE